MSMINSDSDSQGQMTGVTNASAPHFGPARQEHYDKNWQMTVPGDYAKEIWLSPEPADRKRDGTKPAFLRPSTQCHPLSALIKILQTIPLTREAMLCRDSLLSDYGRHPEWWDGTSIRVPEILHEADDRQDHDLEEVLYEIQRLVAFLEDTDRAYGSVDSLVEISGIALFKEDTMVAQFLKAWGAASKHVVHKLNLRYIIKSVALKREPNGLNLFDDAEFDNLQLRIDEETADKGRTLYDVVDDLLWANLSVSDAHDVYLEKVADVFIIDVKRVNEASSGLGIRIPAVWYLDRYLQSSVEEMRNMRKTKAAVQEELDRIEEKIARMAQYQLPGTEAKPIDGLTLLKTASAYFESSTPRAITSDRLEEQAADASPQYQLDKELQVLAEKISQKLRSNSGMVPIHLCRTDISQVWRTRGIVLVQSSKKSRSFTRNQQPIRKIPRIIDGPSVEFAATRRQYTCKKRLSQKWRTTCSVRRRKIGSGGRSPTLGATPSLYHRRQVDSALSCCWIKMEEFFRVFVIFIFIFIV